MLLWKLFTIFPSEIKWFWLQEKRNLVQKIVVSVTVVKCNIQHNDTKHKGRALLC